MLLTTSKQTTAVIFAYYKTVVNEAFGFSEAVDDVRRTKSGGGY